MNFGEKVRKLRKAKRMTQGELARQLGVTQRTVASYEAGSCYPRYRKIYIALAEILNTTVDYLKTENDDSVEGVADRGRKQAEEILRQTQQMFAGGELSDEDELAFITELQQLYLDSLKRANKFEPLKFTDD